MSIVNRKVLAAAFVVALTAFSLSEVRSSARRLPRGRDTTYLVLAPQGNSTAKAAARVAAAGGTVVANYSQIGVLVARSTNPDFAAAASGSGVEAVASTTGLGTPLQEDEVQETVGSAPRRPPAIPRASRCSASSGT